MTRLTIAIVALLVAFFFVGERDYRDAVHIESNRQ